MLPYVLHVYICEYIACNVNEECPRYNDGNIPRSRANETRFGKVTAIQVGQRGNIFLLDSSNHDIRSLSCNPNEGMVYVSMYVI
jgi:hypothetical protein